MGEIAERTSTPNDMSNVVFCLDLKDHTADMKCHSSVSQGTAQTCACDTVNKGASQCIKTCFCYFLGDIIDVFNIYK